MKCVYLPAVNLANLDHRRYLVSARTILLDTPIINIPMLRRLISLVSKSKKKKEIISYIKSTEAKKK